MLRFLILIGYVEWMLSLRLSGKLDQYINVHYQYLITLSIILASVLALIQLIVWVQAGKKPEKMDLSKDRYIAKCTHQFETYKWYNKLLIYVFLALPLVVGFFFPTVSLDASIVQSKGFTFPESKEVSAKDGDIDVQYLKPNTRIFFNEEDYENQMSKELKQYSDQDPLRLTDDDFLTVTELIYNYPSDFVGKEVKFIGFVFRDPVVDEQHFFVFRFGILHCVADAGVFGFLCIPDQELDFKNNNWVEVTGTVEQEYYAPFKATIPAIHATQVKKIKKPANQYVYYDFN